MQIREVIKAQGIRVYTPPIESDDEPSAEQAKLLIVRFDTVSSSGRFRQADESTAGLDAVLHHRKHGGGTDRKSVV